MAFLHLFEFLINISRSFPNSPPLTPCFLNLLAGVSAASLVALKSQLAKKQQEVGANGVRNAADAGSKRHRGGGGGSVSALLQRSNPGVSDRDNADRLATKVRDYYFNIFS
jgi:hypothetical protein